MWPALRYQELISSYILKRKCLSLPLSAAISCLYSSCMYIYICLSWYSSNTQSHFFFSHCLQKPHVLTAICMILLVFLLNCLTTKFEHNYMTMSMFSSFQLVYSYSYPNDTLVFIAVALKQI